jgi:hypothetical protein
VQPAADLVAARDLDLGRVRRADVHGVGATDPETAAAADVGLAPFGLRSGDPGPAGRRSLPRDPAARRRRCGEQLGVGVRRVQDDLVARPALDDFAFVHDHDVRREVPGRGQVMGDVEHPELSLVLELVQEVQDLQANRHVQHRHRLVGEEDVGIGSERPGDSHPLALSARQLVGPFGCHVVGRDEIDRLQQGPHRCAGLGARAVDLQRAHVVDGAQPGLALAAEVDHQFPDGQRGHGAPSA